MDVGSCNLHGGKIDRPRWRGPTCHTSRRPYLTFGDSYNYIIHLDGLAFAVWSFSTVVWAGSDVTVTLDYDMSCSA